MNNEKYEGTGATVWGFDGRLIDAEEEIMCVMPFLREKNGTYTAINPVGYERCVFHNEERLFDVGTHIELEQPLVYVPDTALVVVGAKYVGYVRTLVPHIYTLLPHSCAIRDWLDRLVPIQNGFMVMLATLDEYAQYQRMVGETAIQVFDSEFVSYNGTTVSPKGYYALKVLGMSHYCGEMEYFIRKLVDIKFRYEESLLLTGIRAKISPEKLRRLVNVYIRAGKATK